MKSSKLFRIIIYTIVISVLVTVIVALLPITYIPQHKREYARTCDTLEGVCLAISEYAKYHKCFPKSLAVLTIKDDNGIQWLDKAYLKDAWGHHIIYVQEGYTVFIKSYGKSKDQKTNEFAPCNDWVYKLTLEKSVDKQINVKKEIISIPKDDKK